MTLSAASAPASSAAASQASSGLFLAGAASSPAIPFRQDPDVGFPVGGAVLLVVLMAVALWAWGAARVRGTGSRRPLPAWAARLNLGRPSDVAKGELVLVDSMSINPQLRVAVVEWSGGRVLVGVGTSGTPVALDRADPVAPVPATAAQASTIDGPPAPEASP